MFRRTHITTAALYSVAALAVAGTASGATYAAAATSSHTITACVHHSGGGLYLAAHCAAHDRQLTWNSQGPAGSQGPRGPRGPQGLSLFARADQTGTLHQHSPGVTVIKDTSFTGVYHVFFPQDISGCAAVVSQGEASNNGFFPGTLYEAVVQSDPNNDGNPHEIDVYPTDTSGAPRDAGFDLVVAC
jgi:hypothetical protein